MSELEAWVTIQDYAQLLVQGRLLVLCYYPFRSWNAQHRGSSNLHGHSYGKLKPQLGQVDVGVDCWAFRPAQLETVVRGTGVGGTSEGGMGASR